MIAVYLDEDKYLKSYSLTHKKAGCVLVDEIPDEKDPEKLSCYRLINSRFEFDVDKWDKIKSEREKAAKSKKIDELKKDLADTDYKIIKCMEYYMNDLELPYDLEKVHTERQALRDQINALEASLQE